MKRVVIIFLLFIFIVFGYSVVSNGFSIDALNFKIYSYSEIESQSDDLTLMVAAYNKKNDTEFEETLDSLQEAIEAYEEAKDEYEDIIESLGISEETTDENDEIVVASSFPVYEIDFLWATIGNYAKKEGLVITMDVKENSTVSENLGYGLYNLYFVVTGEYINIADFLYDIEDDDELGFEIRDYTMSATSEITEDDDGDEVETITTMATFTLYNVPLNSESLLETVEETTDDETDEDSDSDSTGSDTVTSNSTDDEDDESDTDDE